MPVSVVTPATSYAVTRDDAKMHCRIDGTAEDTAIDSLISAATDYVERYLGRSIGSQTLALFADDFGNEILLERGPVQSVSTVKYYDTSGVEQTLSGSVYRADLVSDPARIMLINGQAWPTVDYRANAVTITYVAGYTTCPPAIRHAMLLLIGDWYRARENTSMGAAQPVEMPHAVTALLSNFRA